MQNKIVQRIYEQTIKEIILSPLFWCGVLIKLTLSALFASKQLTDFFIPFVNYFVSTGLNPYEHFVHSASVEVFPYPALMLYLLAIPAKCIEVFSSIRSFPALELLAYRFPLLMADFTILVVLSSLLKRDKKKVIVFYWLSPVLIYINYIHGQLDVIPMAFIFASLYFLIKEKNYLAYFLLGCSLATKTHVLLIIPFYFAYSISQKKSLKDLFQFFLFILASFVLFNVAYLGDGSFFQMVFRNSQQSKVFKAYFSFSDIQHFYLIPAVYGLLLLKGFSIKTYNKNILIMLLGFTFGILTFFIPPAQGWYYWIIPTFVFFYIRSEFKHTHIFLFLQLFYFLYFLVIQDSDYFQILSSRFSMIPNVSFFNYIQSLGFDAQRIQDVVFTLLQTSVLINCFQIYKSGIQSFTNKKISSTPYFIGIGGDSGAGKTTLSEAIQKIFVKNKTTVIRGDDMHKWERGNEKWKTFTHLDPKANELHHEFRLLNQLKSGQEIMRQHYDHDLGKFTSAARIKPNNVMIFEGLHPFYIKKMRSLYDLKIYVSPDQELHHYWKVVRDVEQRGYTQEKVIQQIKDRAEDSKKYIKTQNKHSDIEISIQALNKITSYDVSLEKMPLKLCLKISNDIHIEPLIELIQAHGHEDIVHTYEENDSQSLILTKELSAETIETIADEAIPNLDDIGVWSPEWQEGYLGFIQLFIAYYITQQVSATHEI